MIEVENLHHISVVVTDLERAKRFYETVLGLKELERPNFDAPGAWYAVGERQLHLLAGEGARPLRGTREIDTDDGHFALRVKSYQGALKHLEALGVEMETRPNSITGWPQIYLSDPDGNLIELNAAELV